MRSISLVVTIAMMPLAAQAQSVAVAPPRIVTLGDQVDRAPRAVTVHRGRARDKPDWQGVSGPISVDPACLPSAESFYPELSDVAGGAGIALEP